MFEVRTKTVSDVLAAIKRQIGDEAGVMVDDTDILDWANNGQIEIVTTNQNLNLTKAVTSITAGRGEFPIQEDAAFSGLMLINSVHLKGRKLRNVSFQEAEEYMLTNSERSGTPSLWYAVAGVLHLYPVPEEDIPQGLSIFFTKSPAKLVNTDDTLGVPDSYFNALIEYIMSKAYEMEENQQMSQMKTQQFEKSLTLQQNRTSPQFSEYPVIRADPEDGW